MNNKKAAIDITITWMASMFILFFLCIILILSVLAIAAKQEASESFGELLTIVTSKENNERVDSDIILQRSLEAVLNKEITFEEKQMTLAEVLAMQEGDESNRKAVELFKNNLEPAFKELMPQKGATTHWWIRLYFPGETIEIVPYWKQYHVGGSEKCFTTNPELYSTFSTFLGKNRLMMCVPNRYHNEWRANKYE